MMNTEVSVRHSHSHCLVQVGRYILSVQVCLKFLEERSLCLKYIFALESLSASCDTRKTLMHISHLEALLVKPLCSITSRFYRRCPEHVVEVLAFADVWNVTIFRFLLASCSIISMMANMRALAFQLRCCCSSIVTINCVCWFQDFLANKIASDGIGFGVACINIVHIFIVDFSVCSSHIRRMASIEPKR